MADISAITALDGVTYSIKDTTARSSIKVIASVEYYQIDGSITCDKTYAELRAAIDSVDTNIPVIKYRNHPTSTTNPLPVQYLYLRERTTYFSTITLHFYEPGYSGEYVNIDSDGTISRGTFAPSLGTPIKKGVITYDSTTETYSCDKTYNELAEMAKYYAVYSFVTYQSKIYTMWSFVGDVSTHTATEIVFRYINSTTNKLESFTFTSSGSITYSEESFGSSGNVDTVNGIQPDAQKNVQVDVELTLAEYNALPASKETDNVNYWIKDTTIPTSIQADDVVYDNTQSGMTATDVQAAVDELSAGLSNLIKYKDVSGTTNNNGNLTLATVKLKVSECVIIGVITLDNSLTSSRVYTPYRGTSDGWGIRVTDDGFTAKPSSSESVRIYYFERSTVD